jgi:hypothetical protein
MNPNDMIRQFRKKPVVIEAVQWTGDNLDAIMAFCAGNATLAASAMQSARVRIVSGSRPAIPE